jgi:glycosyltransferase 2 family protein
MLAQINTKKIIQYILFLGFAVLFLWLAGRNISLDEQLNYAKQAHLWPLASIFVAGIITLFLRAIRWKMLIDPMGQKVDVVNTWLSIMIGYLVNLATPRLGEVARCAVLSKYENIPADKLAGTMVAERAFDFICLVILLFLTYVVEYEAVNVYINNNVFQPLIDNTTVPNVLMGVGLLIILIAAFLFFKKRSQGSENKLVKVFRNIIDGVLSIRKLENPLYFIGTTIIIWMIYWFMTYIGFYAFDGLVNQPPGTGLSVLTIGSLGYVIPTPQGAGAFQYFVTETLSDMYGVSKGLAFTYANVSWITQTLILAIGGFFGLIYIPFWNNKKKKKDAQP